MDGASCYDALILSRSRNPAFAGEAEGETSAAQGNNPMCGDRVRVSLRLSCEKVEAARHMTRGCALCVASADLMVETITGRSRSDALELGQRFTDMLEDTSSMVHAAGEDTLPPAFRAFLPLRTHRSRLRCATLPWTALGEALDQ